MRLTLRCHPQTPCDAVKRIEVVVERPKPGGLALHYFVTGTIADVLLPSPAAPTRSEGLWEHSCFEAFLRPTAGSAYHEFNFAPSTRWAAYAFKRYREGRIDAEVEPPVIEASAHAGSYELRATLNFPMGMPAELGLSAVIEDTNGRKSYWALAHPPGGPDFHHEDCFALQLPPAA
ncbi:DOMON-like domain-containing protein [Allosphingosinicella sp.]|uniref:DOMON-like domain-containing protein n=1 Tax=Allosphingosinicella sp. TaxID=2823234 RepID=UPI002FC1ACFF